MGVMDRFEKGIERVVNGVFAKAFRSQVQPVEIASALRRACDDRAAVVSRGRTLVPNAFVVELGPTDHDRLGEYATALSDDLVANLREHAEHQRYAFVGPVSVELDRADDLDTGVFRVRTATVKGREPGGQAMEDALETSAAREPQPAAPTYRAEPSPVTAASPIRRPWLDIDGHAYPLVGAVTVVGRGDEADIVVEDPGVSRRHVEIRVTSEGPRLVASLRDLGSTNGTLIDGNRVDRHDPSERIGEGTTITFGRTKATYRTGER